jgi:tetratricopeptide (TPR) repeat protein
MRSLFLILLLVCTCLTDLRADMFADALALEKQGQHAQAAARYESMISQQQASRSVLFNLGNCYYESRNYGKSILAYERALLINPRAADVRKNLALTRKEAFSNEVIDLSKGPLHALSRSEWAACIVICALVLGVSSISAWLRPLWRKSAIIIGVLALLPLALGILALKQRHTESARAVVTASTAKLLLSPFSSADEITSCPPGSLMQVIRVQGDYRYLQLIPSNSCGWLHHSEVELIEK